MIEVVDAMGRELSLEGPAERVVSLVPSESASVCDLVGVERLVGRTDYCIEPAGEIEQVASVGGTKGFDVQAVIALRPDLVLANKEENARPLVTALIDAGVRVHVSFPRTCRESNAYLENLCRLLGVDPRDCGALNRCLESVARAEAEPPGALLPVFVPIWKDPWMTFDGRTYASDVLRLSGARNVFEGRARRYPLAADLGTAAAWTDEKVDARDTRYPRIQLDEIAQRGARAVFLPDEPYAFTEADFEAFDELRTRLPLHVQLLDGKDLFWYGTRVGIAIDRLRAQIDRVPR